ncbi:hypothetical protein JCM10449v2_004052 [Rhodotorula kratochvilovae]
MSNDENPWAHFRRGYLPDVGEPAAPPPGHHGAVDLAAELRRPGRPLVQFPTGFVPPPEDEFEGSLPPIDPGESWERMKHAVEDRLPTLGLAYLTGHQRESVLEELQVLGVLDRVQGFIEYFRRCLIPAALRYEHTFAKNLALVAHDSGNGSEAHPYRLTFPSYRVHVSMGQTIAGHGQVCWAALGGQAEDAVLAAPCYVMYQLARTSLTSTADARLWMYGRLARPETAGSPRNWEIDSRTINLLRDDRSLLAGAHIYVTWRPTHDLAGILNNPAPPPRSTTYQFTIGHVNGAKTHAVIAFDEPFARLVHEVRTRVNAEATAVYPQPRGDQRAEVFQ